MAKDVPPSSRSGTQSLVMGSAIHVLFTQILGTFNAFSKRRALEYIKKFEKSS